MMSPTSTSQPPLQQRTSSRHGRADPNHVAPYLTHLVTHHGQTTLVPPQNAGRIRKSGKSKNPDRPRAERRRDDDEPRFNIAAPASPRGPSRRANHASERVPRPPPAVPPRFSRDTLIPDYPPPSFQEAILAPAYIPPPPVPDPVPYTEATINADDPPNTSQSLEAAQTGPSQSTSPCPLPPTLGPVELPSVARSPLVVHTEISPSTIVASPPDESESENDAPLSQDSHSTQPQAASEASSSSAPDHADTRSERSSVEILNPSWDEQRAMGVRLSARVRAEWRRLERAERLGTVAEAPSASRSRVDLSASAPDHCCHCGSPQLSNGDHGELPPEHFPHPMVSEPSVLPEPLRPTKLRQRRPLKLQDLDLCAAGSPLPSVPTTPKSPRFGTLAAALSSTFTLSSASTSVLSPTKPFEPPPVPKRKETSIVRRLFSGKGKERERSPLHQPPAKHEAKDDEPWDIVDRDEVSQDSEDSPTPSSAGTTSSLGSSGEFISSVEEGQNTASPSSSAGLPSPRYPDGRAPSPHTAFLHRHVKLPSEPMNAFPMFTNPSVVSLPLPHRARAHGDEDSMPASPLAPSMTSSSALSDKKNRDNWKEKVRRPPPPPPPPRRRKTMSTTDVSRAIAWSPLDSSVEAITSSRTREVTLSNATCPTTVEAGSFTSIQDHTSSIPSPSLPATPVHDEQAPVEQEPELESEFQTPRLEPIPPPPIIVREPSTQPQALEYAHIPPSPTPSSSSSIPNSFTIPHLTEQHPPSSPTPTHPDSPCPSPISPNSPTSPGSITTPLADTPQAPLPGFYASPEFAYKRSHYAPTLRSSSSSCTLASNMTAEEALFPVSDITHTQYAARGPRAPGSSSQHTLGLPMSTASASALAHRYQQQQQYSASTPTLGRAPTLRSPSSSSTLASTSTISDFGNVVDSDLPLTPTTPTGHYHGRPLPQPPPGPSSPFASLAARTAINLSINVGASTSGNGDTPVVQHVMLATPSQVQGELSATESEYEEERTLQTDVQESNIDEYVSDQALDHDAHVAVPVVTSREQNQSRDPSQSPGNPHRWSELEVLASRVLEGGRDGRHYDDLLRIAEIVGPARLPPTPPPSTLPTPVALLPPVSTTTTTTTSSRTTTTTTTVPSNVLTPPAPLPISAPGPALRLAIPNSLPIPAYAALSSDLPLKGFPEVGRVELRSRRVTADGRVKVKLVLMDKVVDKCGICLSQFKDREVACLGTSCRHAFHEYCLQRWFSTKQTCPLCREPL